MLNFAFAPSVGLNGTLIEAKILVHPQNVRFQYVRFQIVRFTKRQVYKMSGLQNVRSSKRLVEKKNIHIYSVLVFGGNPQVLLQP